MIRLNACNDTAEALALEHVRRQGTVGPDVEAWRAMRDSWLERGAKRYRPAGRMWHDEQWNPVEIMCIGAHAAALLGYEAELFRHRTYSAPPEKRGLWDGGNKGWDLGAEVAGDRGHAA